MSIADAIATQMGSMAKGASGYDWTVKANLPTDDTYSLTATATIPPGSTIQVNRVKGVCDNTTISTQLIQLAIPKPNGTMARRQIGPFWRPGPFVF